MAASSKKASNAAMRVDVPDGMGNIQTIRVITVTDEPLEIQGDEWCRNESGDLDVYVSGKCVMTVNQDFWVATQCSLG